MKSSISSSFSPWTLAAAALAILLTTNAAHAQITVTKEVDYGVDRETTGTFVFATVPSNSSTDVAHGKAFKVLAGSPHSASAPIAKLNDGPAQRNWDSVPESFFAADDATGLRIQVDLVTVEILAEINTFSWHRNSRSPQIYKVYGALAPSNNAPNFTAAAFQDDLALNKLGYKLIATVNMLPQSGGQSGVSIAGKIGLYKYILFDIAPNTFSASVHRSTFYGEIDIVAACSARSRNYGAGLAGTNGVPTITVSALPKFGATVNLVAANSSGSAAQGLVLLGVMPASIGFLGGEVLVTPLVQTYLTVPAGGLVLPFTVPPGICQTLYLQLLQIDAAAAYGASMTPGLKLDLGK